MEKEKKKKKNLKCSLKRPILCTVIKFQSEEGREVNRLVYDQQMKEYTKKYSVELLS